MDLEGSIVGMVDVLKLTYATLDQINSMSTSDAEGPAWNKFWMSLDADTESMMSGEGRGDARSHSHAPHAPDVRSLMSPQPGMDRPGMGERGDSVLPHESASHQGESPEVSAVGGATPPVEDTVFPFKFKAPSGRVHRLQVVASAGIGALIATLAQKLGAEVEQIGGLPVVNDESGSMGPEGFAISYLDNEGDTVSITTDRDLVEAVELASRAGREKVDLFVHEVGRPAMSGTLDPHPGLPMPAVAHETAVRERRRFEDDEDDEEEEEEEKEQRERERAQRRGRREKGAQGLREQGQGKEQVIAGVPNEVLLPGAIAMLAVVIVGVFVVSRSSSR